MSEALRSAAVSSSLRSTLKDILTIALPNIASFLLTYVNELTNTLFIGHTGTDVELAAVGLGNMMQNCVALSVGYGVCAALDSLVSQAHGAGQHQLCCEHLQRGRILVALQLLWMVPLLWFSGDILVAIGQDPAVSKDAEAYNRATILGLFAAFQLEASRKFLTNRTCVVAPAVILAITSSFHVFWCWLFVVHLRLGNRGAGLANSVTWWSGYLLSCAYLRWQSKAMGLRWQSLLGLQTAAFKGWRRYLRLAVPATVHLCSEWWFWEICALVVGYFGPVQLAAHVSTMNYLALVFMPTIGLQLSSATLVGNAVGAGQPRKAKATAWLCCALVFGIWTPIASFTFFGSHLVAAVYSREEEVRDLASNLLRIFAVVGYFDTMQNVMGGAFRGLGKPQIAVAIYLVCYYGIMLPLGCVLAFGFHWKVYGIWASFAIGLSMACALFAVALSRAKWEALADGGEEQPAAAAAGLPLALRTAAEKG